MNYDFISKIYNKRTIDKIQSKIDNLGSLNKLTTKTFLKKRLIISIIIFLLSLYIAIFLYSTKYIYIPNFFLETETLFI